MIDSDALDVRLKQWAREYRDTGADTPGWNTRNLLQTLIEHEGFTPDARGFVPVPIRTEADEVEQVVRDMEGSGWTREALVLRVDFFCPGDAIEDRLQRLRALGFSMSRTGYYSYLAQAKAAVAGGLRRKAA